MWLFLYIYEKPSQTLLGAQNGEKRSFQSIFVVGSTNQLIMKFDFLAFFEAKMARIVILDQKLIVLNDYQQFQLHFEWFLSHFQIMDVNSFLLSLFRLKVCINYTFWFQILFLKISFGILVPHPFECKVPCQIGP